MNELATKPPSDWMTMKEQASNAIKSGFLPQSIKTIEQALTIAMTGRELGIGMMEAFRGINVILGKPSVSPQLMLALARRTGELESFRVTATEDGAKVEVKRKGSPVHISEFGIKEAKSLGLMDKDNYKKQAAVMFRWRAVAEAMRFIFPDAISGLYTPEEMGENVAVSDLGEMTIVQEAKVVEQPKEKVIEPVTEAEVVDTKTGEITLESTGPSAKAIGFYHVKLKAAGITDEAAKRFIKMKFTKDSVTELDRDQFTQTIKWLEELAKVK